MAGRLQVGDLLQGGRRRHRYPGGGEQPRRPRPGADDDVAGGHRGAAVRPDGDLPAVIGDAGDANPGPDRQPAGQPGGRERAQGLVGGDHGGLGLQQRGPADGDAGEPGCRLAGREQLAGRAGALHPVQYRLQPVAERQVRRRAQDPLA